MRIILKGISICLAAILLFTIGIFGYLYFTTQLPNTEEMHSFYSSRQVKFEKINIENISRLIAGQPIDLKENKKVGYIRMSAELKPTISIKYYTHQRGFGVGAFGTGIAYLETPPNKIYASLEAMTEESGPIEGFVGYGHITGNWYYFRWELD